MQITLYTINEAKNVIGKTLTNALSIEGTVKDETSIITPIIKVKRNDNIISKNYMYIPEFSRYYFITDIKIDGAFFTMNCEVDVLETYKTAILNSEQIIARQEYKFNRQLKDERLPRYSKVFQTTKKIGNSPFNSNFTDNNGRAFTDPDRYNFTITVSNNE